METNTALGGLTFRLTSKDNFYFGSRRVAVANTELIEKIRSAIDADNVFWLRDLFVEAGGSIKA